MKIQVNSDSHITGDTRVTSFVADEVSRVLNRFATKLTRVEVHLSDVNSHKFGTSDKRCLIEARPARHRPLTVSNAARTVKQSVGGALTKMRSSLRTFFERLGRSHHGSRTASIRHRAVILDRPEEVAPESRKRSSAATKKQAIEAPSGNGRSPKKKGIYQARRKSWPSR
jgi:hypothetical protein